MFGGEQNRIWNCKNPHQGKHKKVLCVCSAGLLRSPTAAEVLSREPFNFNTRAAGINPDFALIKVDDVLIEWADEFVCMSETQALAIQRLVDKEDKRPIICLDIEDRYGFRDERLQKQIADNYNIAMATLKGEGE